MTAPVSSEPFLTFEVEVGEPVSVGTVAGQVRRYVPLVGGKVTGQHFGAILPGGVDWQTIGPKGRIEISARYVLDLEEGRVEVGSEGLRSGRPEILERLAAGEVVPAGDYYFRTAMRFYTAAPALARLNDMMAVAVGERLPGLVRLQVYEVL